MKIRAAVLEEFAKPLVVQEVELGGPQAGEVLVKLEACGVCHTDVYTASGVDPSGYAPCVLGHEGAGVVEEVGAGVTSLAKGDHVVTLFSPECGECLHCKSGKTNICLAIRAQQGKGFLPDGTTRLSRGGEPLRNFMGCSTFAEYTVMPEIALAKIDKGAAFEGACLLACGATTGLAAALYKAEVAEGSSVAVFGTGMVGLGAIVGAKLRGAEKILALDLSAERLELAKRFGATHTLLVGEGQPDAVEQVLAETDGFGADYTFEATGVVSVMGQAVEAARMGWGLCTILGVAGRGEKLEIVPRFLITGRRVQGGSFGGARGRTHVPELAKLYADGKLDLDGFVSHRISLDDVNEGFHKIEAQDGIRTVIVFG
jgi:S-(hydroxymethyl)glutathione dehydrogenase/alcohol dehydrogenase